MLLINKEQCLGMVPALLSTLCFARQGLVARSSSPLKRARSRQQSKTLFRRRYDDCDAANDVLKLIKEKEVKFADLRFTDTRGKEQHVTNPRQARSTMNCSANGKMFDGSSNADRNNRSPCIVRLDRRPQRMLTVVSRETDIVDRSSGEREDHVDSLMPFQPAIDEPSNILPSRNSSSSTSLAGIVTCCSLPRYR